MKLAILLLAPFAAGCNPGPDDRADAQPPRSPPPHSIARAQSQPAADLQTQVERGSERYAIFCTPCHGATGQGDGAAVAGGFPAPPSFHGTGARNLDVADIVEIISEGQGLMLPMAERIAPPDRRAIAAYVKTLQFGRELEPVR